MTARFTSDLSAASHTMSASRETVVGSGHALLALRADWQRDLLRIRDDCGFEYVRFHGILDDDLGTLSVQMDQPLYSFHNADQIFDFLVGNGMKPFVELSFMPRCLSSGGTTVFHYEGNVTPPAHYGKWITLITKLVTHCRDRYGATEVASWFFEAWNEPNLDAFWTGSQADYFKLYEATARAVKSVDEAFRVGGPATASNSWLPEFLAFCEAEDVPHDFISTHHYPTDAFGKPGDDTAAQLEDSHLGVLREQVEIVRNEVGELPLYYTEWCTSSNSRDALHDDPYAAAYITHTVMGMGNLVQGYSYWAFSDIFEENYFPSKPFHGGFGLTNIHGIPKPSYRAYELMHRLGTEQCRVEGQHQSVFCWVVLGDKVTTVLLVNLALPRHEIETEDVTISLTGLRAVQGIARATIDADHCNPKAQWQKFGEPDYPSPMQVEALVEASRLRWATLDCAIKNGGCELHATLAPQSVTAIEFSH